MTKPKRTDKARLDWLGKNEVSLIMAIPGLWWILKKTIAPMLIWIDRDYIDAAMDAEAKKKRRKSVTKRHQLKRGKG